MASNTNNMNMFSDWISNCTKMFGDMKAPSMDVSHIITHVRKDGETTSTILQMATESAQAMGRRQSEILRSNAEHAMKASKDLMNNATPESAASKQADFAKAWLEYNVNSVRELMEMGTKSAQEVFDVLNKRAAEKMKEFSEVASSAATTATKKKAA